MGKDYSEFNKHLILADPYLYEDEDEIEHGFAIRSEDMGSFMVEFRRLVDKYGVGFDELLDNDWDDDTSQNAYMKAYQAMREERRARREPIDVDGSIVVEDPGRMLEG